MSFRKRKDVASHDDILNTIITFKEIFCYIFYKPIGNPKIKITAYDPIKKENLIFEISTKYKRDTTQCIVEEYWRLVRQVDCLGDFNNIVEVLLITRGTVYGCQSIYYNHDTPCN